MDTKPSPGSPIRAIKLRQDLVQIADLIELCFAENIDAEGRDYIRHIRQTARNFSSLILENTTPETSNLPFHGYVWEEGGRIIGNLTLIPLRRKENGGYFIANVAVDPEYRGKGIARKLTERALRHVREHHGREIYLQVRADNDVAVHIYRTHGFEEIARRTMWISSPSRRPDPVDFAHVKITPRKPEDWEQQKVWLQQLYPPEITWNLPYRLDRFEPSFSNWFTRLLSGDVQRNWAARIENKLIGTVTLDRRNDIHDFLWVASSPAWEDAVIQSLLPLIQKRVLFPLRLAVNYPAGRARDSFMSSGMKEVNTLIWMKNRVFLTDAPIEIRS